MYVATSVVSMVGSEPCRKAAFDLQEAMNGWIDFVV